MVPYFHHMDHRSHDDGCVAETDFGDVWNFNSMNIFKATIYYSVENLLWCDNKIALSRLIDFAFGHQLCQAVIDHFVCRCLHVWKSTEYKLNRWIFVLQQCLSSPVLIYLTDNLMRIFSIVADCPCDVKSMMTSQRASGNGVNCPCGVGITMQSSMSPAMHKNQR